MSPLRSSLAAVCVALVVTTVSLPVAAQSETTASDPTSVDIPADEPEGAQFVPGQSNYVKPEAAPATDIGGDLSTGRRSAIAPTYSCPGYSGVDSRSPVASVMKDTYAWGEFAPVVVGDGQGNIDWNINKGASWYMWFHSLRWLGQAIEAGRGGNEDALAHAAAIAHDWVREWVRTSDVDYWKRNVGAWESTMHRTNVLICIREAVLESEDVDELPAKYDWLDAALVAHAKFLIANWGGAWNHGTDESIALFGVGCLLKNQDYKTVAQDRLALGITSAIDPQGSTNEQSTAYAQFNYYLWERAENALRKCNVDPGTTIGTRRAALATWVAHATDNLGTLAQIGDSEIVKTRAVAGTPLDYVASDGNLGVAPADRVKVYDRGYVFGRSSWGTPGKPFSKQSAYSIRFGESRSKHGHNDHMSLTYTARGKRILVDSGHTGYTASPFRTWSLDTAAHNAVSTPATKETTPVTKLSRQLTKDNSDFFEFTDVPGKGITRKRGVLVMSEPDVVVTLDQLTAKKAQQFQALWHLPSEQKATVYSRTTAIAQEPGSPIRTLVFQIPYKQTLPAGAILIKRGISKAPIQGWHYPNINTKNAAPTALFARSGKTATILSVIAPVDANLGAGYKVRPSGKSTIVDMTIGGKPVSFLISSGGGLVRQ